jgi:hypothetical protein
MVEEKGLEILVYAFEQIVATTGICTLYAVLMSLKSFEIIGS